MTGRRRASIRGAWLEAILGASMALAPMGCSIQRKHEVRKIPQYGLVDAGLPGELRKVTLPTYVIEPPDELEVEVRPDSFGIGRRLLTVQPDGVIDLGFAGDAFVTGLTLAQAERAITARLKASPREDDAGEEEPISVSVRLADRSKSKVYYVIGAVSSEGEFPIEGGETVLKVILQAGLRSNSLPEKAYLVRPSSSDAADQVYRIDWGAIKERGDPTTNYQIFPGDRVVVPGTRASGLLRSLIGG